MNKEFRCTECGQFLGDPLTKHTYEDCNTYKEKIAKELGYHKLPDKEVRKGVGADR
uniref:Uncharacterized protein n=1 Tax=viral metagenome TaxID=1070528 RepID=A0A6M3LLI5_9ZZZZ